MIHGYYGIVGLIIFILDIWAIVKIIDSGRDIVSKLLWIILILVLPVIGLIFWFLMGSRR